MIRYKKVKYKWFNRTWGICKYHCIKLLKELKQEREQARAKRLAEKQALQNKKRKIQERKLQAEERKLQAEELQRQKELEKIQKKTDKKFGGMDRLF